MRIFLVFEILFVLLLAACAPFPHSVTLSPSIDGQVVSSGVAIEGARVYVSKSPDSSCDDKSEPIYSTDRQGRFHIEPTHQIRWIYAPLVAPLSVAFYNLCIDHGRSPAIAYRGLVSLYQENKNIILSCDLERLRQLTLPDMSKIDVACVMLRQ